MYSEPIEVGASFRIKQQDELRQMSRVNAKKIQKNLMGPKNGR